MKQTTRARSGPGGARPCASPVWETCRVRRPSLRPWSRQPLRRDHRWQQEALRQGRLLRLFATLAITTAVLIVSGIDPVPRFAVAGAFLAHHALASLVEKASERRPRLPVLLVNSILGIATVLVAATLLVDAKIIALFAAAMLVAYFATVGGGRFAVATTAVVAMFVLTLDWLDTDSGESFDAATFATYIATLVALAFVIDALTQEQFRTSTSLERLHEALRSFTADPHLDTTLESIARAAGRAVDADDTAILLREADHLTMMVPSVHAPRWTTDRVAEWTRADLASGDGSPMAAALSRRETVVVSDMGGDPRFPRWSSQFEDIVAEYGYRSVVVVPLLIGSDAIGLIHAAFKSRRRPGLDAIRLLEAYAEQASLVIARAQAYEEEKRLAERLADADRLKSEFLALVSHELRTPLTAVKGFVDTVLLQWDRLDDAQRRDLLARASARADELNRLITQILDYVRIEGGEAPLYRQPMRVKEAVERVVASLSPLLEDHLVGLEVGESLIAYADGDAFAHTLTNLLSNAAKFSPPGGRIDLRASESGGRIEVSVTDDGPGIAPDERERVFDRFYQSPANRVAGRGAGLGLAVARRYVEACGGQIWVEERPGSGARFVFTLPCAASAA